MNTLRLYKSRTGYRWTYTHRNGRKLANGGQGYSRRMDMIKAVQQVFPDFTNLEQFWMPGHIGVLVKDETLTGRSAK